MVVISCADSGPNTDRVNPYLGNSGHRSHLRIAGPSDAHHVRAACRLLALLAAIRDAAMNLERVAHAEPAGRLPVTPDRVEPATARNPIGHAAGSASLGHLS